MSDTKLINANIDENAGIAWLTLSRPEKKNALSIVLLAELSSLLRSLAENDQIRCIVTAGAGDSYSSGRDLYDMRGQDNRRRTRGFGGVAEIVDIMRKLWSGREISYQGKFYSFDQVDIHPSPAGERSIPIWYCGNSPASARRAVEYCDGWMPGRITIKTFAKRVDRMRNLAAEAGKPVPTAASIPITSPGRTRDEAIAKVNWRGMLEQAIQAKWELPDSGTWESPEDLEGALIAGPPDHIVREVRKYHAVGLTHLVFDLRFRFDEWDRCLAILGEEVLPDLRRGDRTEQ